MNLRIWKEKARARKVREDGTGKTEPSNGQDREEKKEFRQRTYLLNKTWRAKLLSQEYLGVAKSLQYEQNDGDVRIYANANA